MPRRLSLSIGRCSAYERSNDAPGIRRVRPYAVPSPSGISLMSVELMTWPIVALPDFELRALAHDEHRFRDARRRERRVELHAFADVHLDALILPLLEAAQLDGDGVRARQQQHGCVLPRVVRRLHDRGVASRGF